MGRLTRGALVPIFLGAFFLCLYLVTGSSDLKHNGDTDLRYQATQAIVDYHRLWVADPLWHDVRMVQGVGGHWYVSYGPGQPIFMIPLYVAGRVIAHHLNLPYDVTTLYAARSIDLWLGAILAVVFYFMARSVGFDRRVAAVLTMIFGVATTAWPDAQSALEQTQVDLFLLLAVYGAWRFVRGDLRERWWLVFSGTAAGLGFFTRYDFAIYLPLLALMPACVRVVQHRVGGIVADWLVFGVSVLPWILFMGVWDYARFANPFDVGLRQRAFGEPFLAGFLGLTISPGKGLIWYVPLLFFLPWAYPRFVRRLPALAVLFAAIVAVALVFYSTVNYWHGDPAWGPRYLYVALPYLILPLGEILVTWKTRAFGLKLAFAAVIVASICLQFAAVAVTQWRFWYRLEVINQRGAHADAWTGQPFHWGATRYHYYWNIRESPILMQFDDLYQVARMDGGDRRYRLTAWPDPYVSNAALNYPVNTLSFWWADTRHPLLGNHTRAALALGLGAAGVLSLAGLAWSVSAAETQRRRSRVERDVVARPVSS